MSRPGLSKSITVRIFELENRGSTRKNFHSPPGKSFTQVAVDNLLADISEQLEARYPDDEFGLVELRPFAFNIVWRGKRTRVQ
jgi:hypothetical protein